MPILENVLRIEPVGVLRLRRYAEGASQQIEVVDIVGAEIGLQRSEHVGHVNAEHLRLGAIDIEVDLGCRAFEQREDLLQARRLRGATHHGGHRRPQRLRAAPGAVLDHHAEAAGGDDAADGWRRYDQNEAFLDYGQLLQEGSLERGTRFPRILRALLEWLESDEDGTRVRSVGEGGAGEAD